MTTSWIHCEHFLVLDLVWIAFGSQYALHLFEVNVERGIMIDLEITVGAVFTRRSLSDRFLFSSSTILEHSAWSASVMNLSWSVHCVELFWASRSKKGKVSWIFFKDINERIHPLDKSNGPPDFAVASSVWPAWINWMSLVSSVVYPMEISLSSK